jgi:hypothetical protein
MKRHSPKVAGSRNSQSWTADQGGKVDLDVSRRRISVSIPGKNHVQGRALFGSLKSTACLGANVTSHAKHAAYPRDEDYNGHAGM